MAYIKPTGETKLTKIKLPFDYIFEDKNLLLKNSPEFIKKINDEFELEFPNELRPCLETFCDKRNELEPLFKRHYDEISIHKKHGIDLTPKWVDYQLKEFNGEMIFITLRKQGNLIGYFTGFLVNSLHYQCLTLTLDLFYVVPEARGKRNGNAGQIILDAVKIEARRRGVQLWTMGRKIHRGKHLNKLLMSNGFEPFEVHYALWL